MDAVTGSPGKTQPFLVKGMEACVRVRWSRAKPFSSRLPLRPSVRLPRSPPARSLARGNSKLLPFTHSLAHSPNAGPASRARAGTPRPHLSLSPSLSPSFHLRHLQERSAGGAAGAGALWRCRLEGDLRPRSSLPLSFSFLP